MAYSYYTALLYTLSYHGSNFYLQLETDGAYKVLDGIILQLQNDQSCEQKKLSVWNLEHDKQIQLSHLLIELYEVLVFHEGDNLHKSVGLKEQVHCDC